MAVRNLLKRGGKDMKRVVKIVCENRDGKDYYILSYNNKEILVDKSLKKVSGKDLFEKIYLDYSKENFYDVEVDDLSLTVEDKKVFGNYIKTLFEKINNALKKQFAVEEE